MPADVYANLKGYFNEIDPCVDPNNRRKQLNEVGKKIRSDLEQLERKKEWVCLGTMFKAWNEMDWGSILPPFAFEPSEELCFQLKKNRAEIDAQLAELSFKRAENLLYEVKKNNVARYTDRHRLVEKALDLVIDRCDSDKIWRFSNPPAHEIYAFIAKCYLFRSRLALPKGSSIPEKKLEALKKGWEWVKKTSLPDSSDIDDDFSHWDKQQNQVVDNLKIEMVLEIKRWEPFVDDSWLKRQIEYFFNNNTKKLDENNLIHWRVCDIAEEAGMANKSKFLLNISNSNSRQLPLYQAKAAYRHNSPMFNKYLEESVKKLDIPFSDPLWDETVKLIETAAADSRMNGCWEESAIQSWAQCENMAQKLRLSVQVRWYWARHRKLYDLAVRAADKCKDVCKCAEIADSQKNRPTVKLKNMETRLHSLNTSNEDCERIEMMIEAETCFAIENYQAGLTILNKLPMPASEEIRNLQDMPDGWGAVHFYVCEDKQAYAFVFTGQCCEKFTFSAENLWKKYVRWNTDGEKDSFEELCEEFGNCFQDIFCWLNDKASGVLFIPHGFLHLVPLHAARVKKNGETKFLFEIMTCVYLPSWSLSPLKKQQGINSGVYAFSNWQNWDTTPCEFCNSAWNCSGKWDNAKTVNNSADDIINTINNCEFPPKLLVMYSHGKHDPNNPYQSSLIMNKSDITHQMILKNIETGKLSGADIILTACETDLAPGDMGLADEHLSLANAFLTKDARAVLGTLYKCKENKSLELISKIKQTPGMALYEVLQDAQQQWLANNEQIEDIAVYRVMGFPYE